MNREAAKGSNLLKMAAVGKLEETIISMKAFAQRPHEQLINSAWAS